MIMIGPEQFDIPIVACGHSSLAAASNHISKNFGPKSHKLWSSVTELVHVVKILGLEP